MSSYIKKYSDGKSVYEIDEDIPVAIVLTVLIKLTKKLKP